MDEDWDDDTTNTNGYNNYGVISEGGTKFAAGRGFKSVKKDNNDEWGNNDSNYVEDSGWGNDTSNNYNGDYNQDRRGGGGRGGRGGRGSRGGYSNGRYQENGNDNGDENGDGGYNRGRGRGGRGGGRGGGRSNNDDYTSTENAGDGEEPKKEYYIPVDRTTEEDLFTTGITTGINFLKMQGIEVNVSGENVPAPIKSFETSGLRPHLIENVKRSGYSEPTPIQKYSIPTILNGRDLMGCAQTGSGKTAAFLLPIIHCLMAAQEPPVVEENRAKPNVIIVSPTRELAIQIYEQAHKFSFNSIVKVVKAYGGTSTNHQRQMVLRGCHILVATPGRLNDFVDRGCIAFDNVKFFVLDEADRMLDMGFLPTVEKMLGNASMSPTGDRQTLMFSATFPEEIQHLAGKFLHNYVFIAVGIVGSASTDVEQSFIQVAKFEKRGKLLDLLKEDTTVRTLVFVETKRNADFLAAFLSENDIKTTSIHGDRLQRERETALWDFKKGICQVLVATGVAARGLDIEGVQHVINFDLPNSVDEYVHRIGRTGRVGNRGRATSFFDPDHDATQAGQFSRIMKQAGQKVPDWLVSGNFETGGQSFGGRDIRADDFGTAQNFDIVQDEPDEDW